MCKYHVAQIATINTVDFFKLIFTDEILENIVKGINDYVALCKNIIRK